MAILITFKSKFSNKFLVSFIILTIYKIPISDNILVSESDFVQKKKMRILRDKSLLSKQFSKKCVQLNVQREMFKEERAKKRESSISMYRKYRIGDFPDIEITNASVIKPLIELAKVSVNLSKFGL